MRSRSFRTRSAAPPMRTCAIWPLRPRSRPAGCCWGTELPVGPGGAIRRRRRHHRRPLPERRARRRGDRRREKLSGTEAIRRCQRSGTYCLAVANQHAAFFRWLPFAAQALWYGGKQAARVGVVWPDQHPCRRTRFHHPSGLHHLDPIADPRDDGQIVADQHDRQSQRAIEFASRLITWPCSDTSSEDTGSSATSNDGRVAKARAIPMRWRCPPESSCG